MSILETYNAYLKSSPEEEKFFLKDRPGTWLDLSEEHNVKKEDIAVELACEDADTAITNSRFGTLSNLFSLALDVPIVSKPRVPLRMKE